MQIETARVLEPLLKPSPYKGAWGGRGKSHFMAGTVVEHCRVQPYSVLSLNFTGMLRDCCPLSTGSNFSRSGLCERSTFAVSDNARDRGGTACSVANGSLATSSVAP